VNSGTRNSLVWGTELVTTSNTTSPAAARTIPTAAALTCGSPPVQCPIPHSPKHSHPELPPAPTPAPPNVVTNAPAGTPLSSSFYLFDSSTLSNTFAQRICGLSSGLTYNAIVRYTFVAVAMADTNTSANQNLSCPLYDLQILVDGTRAMSGKITPSQREPGESYSASVVVRSAGTGREVGIG